MTGSARHGMGPAVDDGAPGTGRGPGRTPIAVSLLLAAALAGALFVFGSDADPPREAPDVVELGPFGPPLEATLAYLGSDRVLYLIDLRTGDRLGSKSIPNDRRPAAVSAADVYLGRLSAAPGVANWDSWRALPWNGTMYRDVGPGAWLAYVPAWDAVVAAGRPLPDGRNGIQVVGGPVLAVSAGRWGAVTPIGSRVLARETAGTEVRWWAVGGDGSAAPVPLPAGFRPVAGGPGVVAGEAGGVGMIVDVATGQASFLDGPVQAAAAWDESGTRLAVATADPGRLCAYARQGSALWCTDLEDPVSPEWGGVSWSPDGSFLVTAEAGTLAAFRRDGARIGALDTLAPRPQTAAAWVRVLPPREQATVD